MTNWGDRQRLITTYRYTIRCSWGGCRSHRCRCQCKMTRSDTEIAIHQLTAKTQDIMLASPSPGSPLSSEPTRSVDEDSSPLPSSHTSSAMARRRRKRIAIELPADQASNLDKVELKKWKNRIAAARARERTQQQVHELQAMVDRLWRENQQQKALIEHLKGVVHTLQPNYDYASNYEPTALFTPDPTPLHYPHHHGGADLQYGVNAMTNGILAELGDAAWMFSSQSQE